MNTPDLRLSSMDEILASGGVGRRSNFLRRVKRGTFTPPIKLGRSNAWPAFEINSILAAQINGATDDQLRKLVAELVEQRKSLMPPSMVKPK